MEPDGADRRRAELMRAAQDGDGAAYAALLRECVGLARAVARRQGVPPQSVEDVVQEVLLTVHRVRHTYDPRQPFEPWLAAIARRRAIDALRRDVRRQGRELHAETDYDDHPDPAPGPEAAARAAESGRRLREAIAALPPRQREAVRQLGLSERSLAEAASATGRTEGALKVNLHRALKTLRGMLDGER